MSNSNPQSVRFKSYNAKELLSMDFPKLSEIVAGLLTESSVTILGAPSKMGKSWLMLDMALSVCNGVPFLGYPTKKSSVLYLALEDSLQLLSERLTTLLGETPAPDNLICVTESVQMGEKFFLMLENEIANADNLKVVIIDTMQKIKPPSRQRNEYEDGYNFISPLCAFAKEKKIAIILVHHTKKDTSDSSDPFMDLLGSSAFQAAVDSMMVMRGNRVTKKDVALHVTGRNLKETLELSMDFDNESCRWKNNGNPEEIEQLSLQNNSIVKTIIRELNLVIENSNGTKKELAVTMKMLKGMILKDTNDPTYETLQPKQLGTKVRKLVPYLNSIGIEHSVDEGTTTINTAKGFFHRFTYK